MNTLLNNSTIQRRRWIVRGQVQGVGFRPYVFRLAQEARISGFVANDNQGVIIEGQGPQTNLEHFLETLKGNPPPMARIDTMSQVTIARRWEEKNFHIISSDSRGTGRTDITPDTALCPQCRQEIFDHTNRRFHHGLVTCTNCGPRYSIILDIPYDRPATTMAEFPMCPKCQKEYDDPASRRFHAQPISCPDCGPQIQLVNSRGEPLDGDPIVQAADMLMNGAIIAIKGIGGFHLAARADDEAAVMRLRQLKQRDAKPFAIMCRSVSDARQFIKLSPEVQGVMESTVAPIILAMRQADAPVAEAVAGNNCRLGVMLPYTPIHHLLFSYLDKDLVALVMTSGNITDEPLAISNSEALKRLGRLCDGFLWHNRTIARSVDDSVLLDMGPGGPPVPIRRSRGMAPSAIALTAGVPVMGLCLGGEMKNTVALVADSQAILSQHLGDLHNQSARRQFIQTIDDLCRLYKVRPQFIAHDLHPMYLSAQYATQLAKRFSAPLIAVQHHHAHAAAVLAEHGLVGPVLAFICDGTGLGPDATAWGCELLCASSETFQRIASLNPLLLPGGDVAAQDISRSAFAVLHQTFGEDFDQHPLAAQLIKNCDDRQMLKLMMTRNLHCVISSSAGRLFDAVAALLGLCTYNSFEAQAPMALESAAAGAQSPHQCAKLWDFIYDDNGLERLDFRPLIKQLIQQQDNNVPVAMLAAEFQHQFAAGWADIITRKAVETNIHVVALSGGVFANQLLTADLSHQLQRQGLRVLRHKSVPCNDGGLALGQALVSVTRWNNGLDGRTTLKTECGTCA